MRHPGKQPLTLSPFPPTEGGDFPHGGEWIPISSDPQLLAKWLRGEADIEALKNWLKSIYPEDMHEDILAALAEDVAPGDILLGSREMETLLLEDEKLEKAENKDEGNEELSEKQKGGD